jgi:hypothetical protein
VQLFAKTDPGGEGYLQWTGIRTHSVDQAFITHSETVVDPALRGFEGRRAPVGGWSGVGLDIHYRSGSRTATVSLHMLADDRGTGPGKCKLAGTGIAAG